MENKIVAVLHDVTGCQIDVEIPLYISAKDLMRALHIGLRHAGDCPEAMRAENPHAFLTGDRPLADYQLRNGTNLYYFKR